MKVIYRFLGLGKIEFSFIPSSSKLILLLLLVSNMFISSSMAQDLDPNLPPGENFDLSYWKLTRPNQQERDSDQLAAGYTSDDFYTDPNTGAMVFWCPNDGATGGSTYPRSELREMIRRFDTSIPTQGINKNNWVFSSSSMENQEAAGGVDGTMTATVAVNHVSETSDENRKIGRTIVGQIHASNDEPCRLYYRKLPGNTKGAIYLAHEPITGPEQWYDMIGSRSDGVPDPVDGVALGEQFSYEIKVVGDLLTVTIMREGKDDVVQEVDMTNSGFANDWMYFKAGNYNQNNAGDPDEFALVSFFALDITHAAPTPPTEYLAPSDIPRFQPFLAECKLQAPTSSTIADINSLNSGYTHPQYFQVVDGDKILFNQTGDSQRTELRNETNWDLTQANRSLHGRLDIVTQTCDQFTVMQIHDDANAGSGPNKPLLRVYKDNTRIPTNHLWAAIKTDDVGINTTHFDLGEDPGGYFNCDVRLVDGNMIIDFEGEEKVNMDVSFWTWPSYWKAGAYLQDDGEATVYFDDLFEEDGTQQNFFPSVTITSPENNTNFEPGGEITITVEADDSDGNITLVEFFEGGINKLGEDDTAPYSFTWTGYDQGEYTLTAKATDNESGSRTSLSTLITVSPQMDVNGIELMEIGNIAVGGTAQLQASIIPASATNQNFTFESDDTSIATVNQSGLVSGISAGEVTFTVTTDEGGFTDEIVIDVLDPSSGFNWALFRPVVGTGTADGANVAENLVDDNTDTRWSVQTFPQSVTVDLGQIIRINATEVTCYQDRAYQFTIAGSENENGPFSTFVHRLNNSSPGTATSPIINEVDNHEARYVRITVTGADVYTGPWASLTELRVFGVEGGLTSVSDDFQGKIQLSPNPATSTVTINDADEYHTVSIYDQLGRIVLQRNLNSRTLDISQLQSGIYIVRLEGNDKPLVGKLIKH